MVLQGMGVRLPYSNCPKRSKRQRAWAVRLTVNLNAKPPSRSGRQSDDASKGTTQSGSSEWYIVRSSNVWLLSKNGSCLNNKKTSRRVHTTPLTAGAMKIAPPIRPLQRSFRWQAATLSQENLPTARTSLTTIAIRGATVIAAVATPSLKTTVTIRKFQFSSAGRLETAL